MGEEFKQPYTPPSVVHFKHLPLHPLFLFIPKRALSLRFVASARAIRSPTSSSLVVRGVRRVSPSDDGKNDDKKPVGRRASATRGR